MRFLVKFELFLSSGGFSLFSAFCFFRSFLFRGEMASRAKIITPSVEKSITRKIFNPALMGAIVGAVVEESFVWVLSGSVELGDEEDAVIGRSSLPDNIVTRSL